MVCISTKLIAHFRNPSPAPPKRSSHLGRRIVTRRVLLVLQRVGHAASPIPGLILESGDLLERVQAARVTPGFHRLLDSLVQLAVSDGRVPRLPAVPGDLGGLVLVRGGLGDANGKSEVRPVLVERLNDGTEVGRDFPVRLG